MKVGQTTCKMENIVQDLFTSAFGKQSGQVLQRLLRIKDRSLTIELISSLLPEIFFISKFL